MDPATAHELAMRLDKSEMERKQISHFSDEYPDMTIKDAYEIQRAWMSIKRGRGQVTIGHKIGLTSRAMQRAVNITEPDYGLLLDSMLFTDGRDIPFDRFIEPRVEVELAFVLGRQLQGDRVTLFDVLDATNYIVPAIEIIDARIARINPQTGKTRTVLDTISDNAANAGLVLGGRPIKPEQVDLRWVAGLLYRNGVIEESGVAAAVLNHPANGPAWLARALAPFGEALEPGEIILGGSFTGPLHVARGDAIHVDFGQLGNISVRFT